jgi:hypothetical protein
MQSARGDSTDILRVVPRDEWRAQRNAHRARVEPWVQDRVERAGVAKKHPVYDFLFTYYSFRPAYLLRWSPGADVVLSDAEPHELDWPQDFAATGGGFYVPSHSFPEHRHQYISWALRYLTETSNRPATFHCYGLHEWAMLYHEENPRHSQVPLRVSPRDIAEVVESSDLRCTHYDAYRFFTPAATPRNRTALSRNTTTDNDQPGCIHVTMDLYKFAHKIAPWCPSELVADTFLLASEAREVDMRASPYDLQEYGVAPLKIEEPLGRGEYIALQRSLAQKAAPLRSRLITVYLELANLLNCPGQ